MTEDTDLLQKALQEAMTTTAPESPDRKPYIFEQCSPDRVGLPKNKFRVGKKTEKPTAFKLDAEGQPIIHGNGGYIYLKDLSGFKFWYGNPLKLISKAEHDELTNGLK